MDEKINTALRFTRYTDALTNTQNLFIYFLIIPFLFTAIAVLGGAPWKSTLLFMGLTLMLPGLAFILLWWILAKEHLPSNGIVLVIITTLIFGLSMIANYFISHTFLSSESLSISTTIALVLVLGIAAVLTKGWRVAIASTMVLISFYLTAMLGQSSFNYNELKMQFLYASLVVLGATLVTWKLVDSPMKKQFGVSTIKVLRSFFVGWFYGDNQLEELFKEVGEEKTLPIHVLNVEAGKDVYKLLIPSIHFGPFGSLGSSALPSILYKKHKNLTVFHGTATHDLNLTSKEEIKKIERVLNKKSGYNNGFAFKAFEGEKAKAYSLSFGKDALIFLSRAPHTTEDISLSAGMVLREKALCHYRDAAIVDMHNSSAEEITYFTVLSKAFGEYYDAIEHVIKGEGKKPFSFAFVRVPLEGKGASSELRAGLFYGDKKVAVISVDANGIEQSSKEKIEEVFKKRGFVPLLCTTDSHKSNSVSGVINEYVAHKKDLELLEEALRKVKPKKAKASLITEKVKLRVLGENHVAEILTTLNNIWTVTKLLLPTALIITMAALFFML